VKKTVLSLSLLSLLCGSVAFAQSSVATNPVGFISITVNGGSSTTPVLTLISPTLTNPIAYQSTVQSVSGTTITITGASFTANEFNGSNGTFYVEDVSTSQGGTGVLCDITATGSNSVTTAQDISSMVTAGDTLIIRQHITIGQFLGTSNTYGLQGGTSATSADEVLVYDGSSQNTYWYYNGSLGGTAGWYDLNFASASGVTIAPFQGVVIKRKTSGNVTITSTGTVKTGNTFFPVVNGLNVLGTVSAQGLTLGTSGLYTGTSSGVTASTSATTADEVTVYGFSNGSSTQSNYWYYNGSLGGTAGWYDLNFTPSGSVALAPGAAFVVNRKGGGAFNWSLPAPTSF